MKKKRKRNRSIRIRTPRLLLTLLLLTTKKGPARISKEGKIQGKQAGPRSEILSETKLCGARARKWFHSVWGPI
jgi:hypothetical protein